jgi:hypothetical protein
MALKAFLDTLDGVDDAVKAFYTETDGKHVLDVDGIDAHPAVANLKGAYERTKAEKAKASDALKDLQTQVAELSKNKPDEAALVAARKALEDQIAAEKARADGLQQQLTGVTRDRSLADALSAAGVTNPAFVKAATAMLGQSVKIEGGLAVIETDMGPSPLVDYVKRWAAGEGKDFVSPPAGGGAKGNSGQSAGKTMREDDFMSKSPKERAAIMAAGMTLT